MKKIFLLLLSFIAISCSKDNSIETPADQLPPITTTGANTAGCIINGKVLIPKNGINSTSGQVVYGLDVSRGVNFDNIPYGNDYFSISIYNLKDKGQNYWIYIHLNNLTNSIGNYTVNQSNADFWSDASSNPQILARETYDVVSNKTFLSGSNSGTIIITRFDFPNRVISGTFNANLYNQANTSETIQVTNGRFDLRFYSKQKRGDCSRLSLTIKQQKFTKIY
jgi:hypothetical protein